MGRNGCCRAPDDGCYGLGMRGNGYCLAIKDCGGGFGSGREGRGLAAYNGCDRGSVRWDGDGATPYYCGGAFCSWPNGVGGAAHDDYRGADLRDGGAADNLVLGA
jgi:hypothetical protein